MNKVNSQALPVCLFSKAHVQYQEDQPVFVLFVCLLFFALIFIDFILYLIWYPFKG